MNEREHEIGITVIVNGQPVEMKHLNTKEILKAVVKLALDESGNSGQPIDNWELRDAAGQVLDLNKRIADYGITDHARLFLNLKAGVGG
ncbi:hypothetical protein B1A_15802 [mine drainage metagenome]|uniref:Ubiquitin-like domain-containing protein n=1 Tax=mine drainage metagenome TaxID=410659 RepID=T0ZCD6_9ZZZZ